MTGAPVLSVPPEQHELEGLHVALTVRTITPVVGGGVQARDPDTVDIVRVPSIRGHLRAFWRALGDESDAAQLREHERNLWGGVGDHRGSTKVSKLGVRVRVLDPGVAAPAGFHNRNSKSELKAVADWHAEKTSSQALGYALFPLQIDNVRRTPRGEPRVPTRDVRTGASFELRITWPGTPEGCPEQDRLLGALWWWLHFGGIGARTSRGFGALAIDRIEGIPAHWRSRFEPPDPARLPAWLAAAPTPPAGASSGRWRTLRGHEILFAGRPEATAEQAHVATLLALREFRQGIDLGRARGTTKLEGQSHWPEAHMMRFIAEQAWSTSGDWEHPPPREMEADYKRDGTWSAPRAAFGLPLGIRFKDTNDKTASGWIHMSRFPSPLRIRPLALTDGSYAAVCLLYADRPDGSLKVTRTADDNDGVSLDWRVDPAHAALGPALLPYLRSAGGDALQAFALYLERQRGFVRVASGEQR